MRPALPRPVCVITTAADLTADRVVLELTGMQVPVFRLDLADFPHAARLDADLDGTRWTGTLSVRGRTVALQDIGAVWWWHPGRPRIPTQGLPTTEAEWAEREATAGFAGVLAALDCLHLNHPDATRAAQSKPGALAQAARSGLGTPPTWIGNHPGGARRFASASPSGTVCKSLVSPGIVHRDRRHSSFYTTRIDTAQLNDSLALTAHQLQHAIDKQFEVRLIVVGAAMYAARIDAHSAAARADFRADYAALTYRPIGIPDPVRKGVTALLDHYGLCYAAIDLLIDRDDRWWLIDLNPAGHHDWLQHHLPELRISTAIADLLTHPPDAKTGPATSAFPPPPYRAP